MQQLGGGAKLGARRVAEAARVRNDGGAVARVGQVAEAASLGRSGSVTGHLGSSSRRSPPPAPRKEPRARRPSAHGSGRDGDWLWRALAHLGGLSLASRSAAPGSPPHDPLRPGARVAIMPNGEYCLYCPPCGIRDVGEIFPDWIKAYTAQPRTQGGLPGDEAGPLCLPRVHNPNPHETAEITSMAQRMFEGCPLQLCGHCVTAHDLRSVPRNVLDGSPSGLADSVVRHVREHEAALCPGAARRHAGRTMPAPGGGVPRRGPTAIDCRSDEFGIKHYCVMSSRPANA